MQLRSRILQSELIRNLPRTPGTKYGVAWVKCRNYGMVQRISGNAINFAERGIACNANEISQYRILCDSLRDAVRDDMFCVEKTLFRSIARCPQAIDTRLPPPRLQGRLVCFDHGRHNSPALLRCYLSQLQNIRRYMSSLAPLSAALAATILHRDHPY
jgi:hypothetical protein